MFDRTCEGVESGCVLANSNILLSFTDTSAYVIELLFSVVVFVSFPCMLYPIRKSILTFSGMGNVDINTAKGYWIYNGVGLAVTAVCLLLATVLDAIDEIQAFTANLLGIVLYCISAVMLWYKDGQRPIN